MNQKSNDFALSVVIVALNEELRIERAITSVLWASEVILYDSGSMDKTIQIAQKMGVKIVTGDWKGFGATKKLATEFASHDWILSIDADEVATAELATEIKQRWDNLNPRTAYQVPRLSNYLGRWIRHGGWYPDFQVRLFNRKFSNWNLAEIHEKVEALNYESLSQHLEHYVFKDIEHHVQTNNRYSTLQAIEMHKQKKSFSWFHFLTKPQVKFVECYFLKLGFLDGWVGLFIAKSAAYSVLLKWSKLKALGEKEFQK